MWCGLRWRLQVRRELASALRDINGLVGQEHTLQYMWGLVSVTLASLNQAATQAQGQAINAQTHVRAWCQMECAVYAANVVLGRCACVGVRVRVLLRAGMPGWSCMPVLRRLIAIAATELLSTDWYVAIASIDAAHSTVPRL